MYVYSFDVFLRVIVWGFITASYRNYILNKMPKSVDVYVLEAKIGSGQFGDVFRGYSKVDGTDVAIKTIRRDKIKGTFSLI